MEENVALDSNKQKQFMKSLKGLKRLMKKSGPKEDNTEEKVEVRIEKKRDEKKVTQEKVQKKKRKPRGLVYLSHIPHGFYENEMTQYFKQFGVVTNVRVIRSKRTGRSKGHAFVEFKNMDVAQVVAETMNNYLMGKRLIKAVYIPPKDQRRNARRKNWNDQYNPGSVKKLQMKKAYNSNKSENDDLKIATKLLLNLSNTKTKLQELGIDYDFFTPVDVPEALSSKVIVKEEKDEDVTNEGTVKTKTKESKGKAKQNMSNVNNDKNDTSVHNEVQLKDGEIKKSKKKRKPKKKSKVSNDDSTNEGSATNVNEKGQAAKKTNNVSEKIKPMNKKDETKVNVKKAGVKPPEDFITLGNENNEDSDSSYEFDSDQFENMINGDDSDGSENSDNDEKISQQKNGKKKSKDLPAKRKNEQPQVAAQKVQVNKQNVKQQQQNKRKGPERIAGQPKKPKFEKQSKKKLPNKQIKKKK